MASGKTLRRPGVRRWRRQITGAPNFFTVISFKKPWSPSTPNCDSVDDLIDDLKDHDVWHEERPAGVGLIGAVKG
ncbi:MAG TPA: hypothetical protein VE462_12315 [Propionibacteriaceae bacterium]|nr:hypothetical protein [Propionibacteriaceae bacterium]